MDDNNKRHVDAPQATGSVIDLGISPPWSLQPSFTESAIRSTQCSPQPTVDPSRLHKRSTTRPTDIGSFTAINHPQSQSLQPQHSSEAVQNRANADHEAADDEDEGCQVETENGADAVYMLDTKEGSWSGPFPGDDGSGVPPIAELALSKFKRKQEAEEQQTQQTASDASEAVEYTGPDHASSPEYQAKWQRDLVLRNLMRQFKQKLEGGAVLVLDRMSASQIETCSHMFCPGFEGYIPDRAYCVTLSPQDKGSSAIFCLVCLERLWDGEDMDGDLPDANVQHQHKQKHAIQNFSLDGAVNDADGIADHPILPHQPIRPSPLSQTVPQIPESLLSSKHAPKPGDRTDSVFEEAKPKTPSLEEPPLPETPGSEHSGTGSMTSTGEWRHPPTRFQHLASFLRVGSSLSEAEKAAVELWKLATKEQLGWIAFRMRHKQIMQELNSAGSGESEDDVDDLIEISSGQQELSQETPAGNANVAVGLEAEEQSDVDEDTLIAKAGISKQRCQGKDLSAVLEEVHSSEGK